MGETSAIWESILGEYAEKDASLAKYSCLSNAEIIARLQRSDADKLIYVHCTAFGYNKCKNTAALEEALMVKSKNGEKKYGF
jgi:hypothetical protein